MIPPGLCAGVSALVAVWPGSGRWLWALLPWGAFLVSRFGPSLTETLPHNHRWWIDPTLRLFAWALLGVALVRVVAGVVIGPWDTLSVLTR